MTRNKIIILIFLVALASGLFWNQKMFGQPIDSDQNLHNEVALNILNGGQFVFNGRPAPIEPGYPIFLAGIYKIFGHNYNIVRIIQIILFALSVIFIYLLVEKIFNKKITVWSAVIIALFYGLANQAGNILTETLFIFLISVFVWAIYKASLENSCLWFFVSGAVLGVATLTRGIIQFLPLIIIFNILVFYNKKASFGSAFSRAGIFFIAFVLILLPWFTFNRFNNAVGASTVAPRSGEILAPRAELMDNLYKDYPAHLLGHLFGYYFAQKIYPNVNSATFRETPQTEKKTTALLKEGQSYAKIDKILTKEAKTKIFTTPHKYILMSLLDLVSFNSPIIPNGSLWQNTLTIHAMFAEGRHSEIPEFLKAIIILVIRSIWFLFLFLAAYGLIKGLKNPEIGWTKLCWIFLVIIYFNLAYSATHAIPRYALPIYPFYIILAIIGLTAIYAEIKK